MWPPAGLDRVGRALLVAAAWLAPPTHAADPAPAFDVAYRAWEVVTAFARHNRDPSLTGECGRTFQPFVVPALRRQTKDEQAAAAQACLRQARAACASTSLARTSELAAQCREFR